MPAKVIVRDGETIHSALFRFRKAVHVEYRRQFYKKRLGCYEKRSDLRRRQKRAMERRKWRYNVFGHDAGVSVYIGLRQLWSRGADPFGDWRRKTAAGTVTARRRHLWELFYETRELLARYEAVLSEDQCWWVRHGAFLGYHQNGPVACEGEYRSGYEEGLWRSYYDNGQRAAEGRYHLGKADGLWRFWSREGVLKEETCYVSGIEQRPVT